MVHPFFIMLSRQVSHFTTSLLRTFRLVASPLLGGLSVYGTWSYLYAKKTSKHLGLQEIVVSSLPKLISFLAMETTMNQSALDGAKGEIVMYQPDETIRLEVRMEDETVWLNLNQLVTLFQSSKSNISEHIKNIYEQKELNMSATVRKFRTVQQEGNRSVVRTLAYYNLDAIISIGFRVNTAKGIEFRQWANSVLRNYLLKGYAINQRLVNLENSIDNRFESQNARINAIETKVDFFVHSSLPPVEGIFYDGQIFDAYHFVADLIRKATHSIVLIDNYVDDSVLAP